MDSLVVESEKERERERERERSMRKSMKTSVGEKVPGEGNDGEYYGSSGYKIDQS